MVGFNFDELAKILANVKKKSTCGSPRIKYGRGIIRREVHKVVIAIL